MKNCLLCVHYNPLTECKNCQDFSQFELSSQGNALIQEIVQETLDQKYPQTRWIPNPEAGKDDFQAPYFCEVCGAGTESKYDRFCHHCGRKALTV